ncbi:MAG: hypothetical protein V4714_08635 [Bacteroidota bacterium]
MHSIKTLSYSAYRIEEKVTGLSVLLLHSLEETIFELNQPITEAMKAKIAFTLKEFRKYSSQKALVFSTI